MIPKCHLIIRVDDFFPINIGNVIQICQESAGFFSSLTLCPTQKTASRFQKQFESVGRELNLTIQVKSPEELADQFEMEASRLDCYALIQSDVQVGPFWLRTLLDAIVQIPRYATLAPVVLSRKDFQKLQSLKDRFSIQKPLLGFQKISNALSSNPICHPDSQEFGQGYCSIVSTEAVKFLSQEERVHLFSEPKHSAAIQGSWSFHELYHFSTARAVVVASDIVPAPHKAIVDVFSAVEHHAVSTELPPLLYVLHEDPEGSLGGTERHTRDLIESQESDRRVYIFFRRESELILRFYFQGVRRSLSYPLLKASEPFLFSNTEIEKIFHSVLIKFKIGIVHFQHLLGLPLSLLEIARKKCASVITMNDYFLYCQNYDFINEQGRYCGVVRNPDTCDNCLSRSHRPYRSGFTAAGTTLRRRTLLAEELKKHKIIYPSEEARLRFLSLYPLDPEWSRAIEPPTSFKVGKKSIDKDFKVIHIAYLGVFNLKKGASLFRDTVLHINQKFPGKIKWSVFGRVLDAGIAAVLLDQKNVHFFGEYDRSEVTDLFDHHQVDLGLLLSVWPETYSFTLTEFFAAGVPVISTNIGAQNHRIEKSGAGWSVSLDNAPQEIEKILTSIFDAPESFLKSQSQIPTVPSQQQQLQCFRDLYASLLSKKAWSLKQSRAQMDPAEAQA